MDIGQAVKAAIEEKKEQRERHFKDRVRDLVYQIGTQSEELRRLKKELLALEYEEPDFTEVLNITGG